jgi:hypothetical protein
MNNRDFPRLDASNYRITSPATPDYNCIAWSAGDTEHWWQPGVYWPVDESNFSTTALTAMFSSLGFAICDDPELEAGFEKIAVYGDASFYTHAARQLASGKWTSKLGRAEDIEHQLPADVAGGVYGEVVAIMKRSITSSQK